MSVKEFEFWFNSFDDEKKINQIKSKAIEVNNNFKIMQKHLSNEINGNNNRIGARGGKFTSLVCNSQRATETYLDSVNMLKTMTKLL